jgi:hypothetical protein
VREPIRETNPVCTGRRSDAALFSGKTILYFLVQLCWPIASLGQAPPSLLSGTPEVTSTTNLQLLHLYFCPMDPSQGTSYLFLTWRSPMKPFLGIMIPTAL